MANPAIVSVGTPATVSNLIIALTYPTTVVSGKKIFALVSDFNATSSMASTPSADWIKEPGAEMLFGAGASARKFYLLYKISDGTETGSVNFTTDRNTRKVGWMFSTNTATTFAVSAGSSADGVTEINHDQITTTIPNVLLIYIAEAIKATAINITDITPGGTDLGGALTLMTEVARNQTNSNYLGVCYELLASPSLSPLRKTTTSVTPGALGQLVLALQEDIVSGTIVSINDENPITDGQQNVEIIHSGFSTINSVKLICGEWEKSLSFTNSDSTTTLVDFPDISQLISEESGIPFTAPTFDISLEISDGTVTEDVEIILNVKSGFQKVDIVSAITTLGSVFYDFIGTIPDNTQVYYEIDEHDTVIGENGGIETNAPGGTILNFRIFDIEIGYWLFHSILIADPGIIASVTSKRKIVWGGVDSLVDSLVVNLVQ